MSAESDRVKKLFLAALELPDPQTRQAFLADACGDNGELRRRLAALLRAHDDPASVLERPFAELGEHDRGDHELRAAAAGVLPTIDSPQDAHVGAVIGPYKLVEQIGEGGMGTVFIAQQTEPIKRLVALKIIKAGMD